MKDRESLLTDDRGVIMIAGVIFSLLLIGLCWFIFGIGNAIAYRENLQNAADSAAFAAAVYDARGMNLLAMINVIMGVILATLIIAKFIEIAAVLADVEECEGSIDSTESCCADIFGCTETMCVPDIYDTYETCSNDCSDIQSWQSRISSYDSGVHTALKVLHDAEVGIAVGWPWIAAGKSSNVQYYYKDGQNLKNGVGVTSSFSYSQIPWNLDNTSVGDLLGLGGNGANNTAPNPPQTRYGLPVTTDTYPHLCEVAFNDVSTLGGIPANPLSGLISQALNICGQWFCDDATASQIPTVVIEAVPAAMGPQAVAFCVIEDDLGKIFSALKNGLISVENAATPLPMSMAMPGIAGDDHTYSPMMLYAPATMGLDYYGVWSTVIGDYDDTLSSGRVSIAGQQAKSGNKLVAGYPADVYVGVAKAEFYYDPRSTSETTSQETTVNLTGDQLSVMWNMRWRARLRRYHYFPGADGIIDKVIDLMNTGFQNVASQAVQALLQGKNPWDTLIGPATTVTKLPTTAEPLIYH